MRSVVPLLRKAPLVVPLLALIVYLILLAFHDIGIGLDDAYIILASLRLSEYQLFSFNIPDNLIPYDNRNIFFMLFSYSHGWTLLVVSFIVYHLADLFGIPWYTWALILPSTLSIWLAGIATYFITYQITKRHDFAILAAALFLTIPIVVGLSRSYTITLSIAIGLQALYLLLLMRAVTSGSRTYQAAAMVCMGLLIASENAFPVSIALGALLVFLISYHISNANNQTLAQKMWKTIKNTTSFFWNPYIAFPVLILLGYIALYAIEELYLPRPFPFGLGFFGYSLAQRNNAFLGWPDDFINRYFDHLGFGMGLALPVALLGGLVLLFLKDYDKHNRAILIFVLAWALTRIYLVFYYEVKSDAFVFMSLAGVPVSILVTLCLYSLFKRLKPLSISLGIILISVNLLAANSLVFNLPFEGPNLYGTPRGYYYARDIKAVGTILRSEGYSPLKERQLQYIRYGRISGWDIRSNVILAGLNQETVLFQTILYWGANAGYHPNEYTEIVVDIKSWNEDPTGKSKAIAFAQNNGFCLKHVVYEDKAPVAWMYYQDCGGVTDPKKHDKDKLMKEWDRRFANPEHMKTTGPHAR